MRARRALMYMPADDLHKIQKAISLQVDCICMDLEDAVAARRKSEARATAAQALTQFDFGWIKPSPRPKRSMAGQLVPLR
jgi:citrate lyase beta subunit